ncbi:hypothetical protein BURK1_03765 [Burkholderiales bacterium]|nr:hypothetical protein BURK1_03765 [Burkholderiales bacterium]
MTGRFDDLVAAVRANCQVSDARHARSLTLCTYLLEMRELYRWERGAPLAQALPRADVGAWLAAREAEWAAIEDADYRALPLAGTEVDPYDVATVNRALVPEGMVYGAGIGRHGKPQFFVAALRREEWRGDAHVLVAGREFARDLAPAPAATRGGTIHVRLESLARMLWDKAEAWAMKRRDGALKAALDAHGFEAGSAEALDRMVAAEAETLILHELGEREVAARMGPAWERTLCVLERRRADIFMRAARDLLADCLVTLPALLERDARAEIHFWFANLDGMRHEIFPRARQGYEAWRRGDGGQALAAAVDAGAEHWQRVCARIVASGGGADGEAAIEELSLDAATRL